MKTSNIACLLITTLALGACTEFNAVRIRDANTGVPPTGAPYNLTFTQYDIQITQRLSGCYKKKTVLTGKEKTAEDRYDTSRPDVKLSVMAAISKNEVRDPLRTYVIDLASLQSFFKTSDVKVSYFDNGAIKSINAEADDKSGEFAVSTAQTIFKLATAATGWGPQSLSPERCQNAAWTRLAGLEDYSDKLAAKTAEVSASTEALKLLMSTATVLGRATPKADRDRLSDTLRTLSQQMAEQKVLENAVQESSDALAVVTKVKWPLDGETFASRAPLAKALDRAVMDRWIAGWEEGKRLATAAHFSLQPLEPIGRTLPCASQGCADDAWMGLKYRMPALGKLHMCSALDVSATGVQTCNAAASKHHQLDTKPEMISQLGRIYVLPLKSTPFTKKTIAATFSESGVPTLLGATSTAGSDKFASTVGGVADAAIAHRTTRQGREKAALENQLAIGKLKKEIAALEPARDQARLDATAEFKGDTALLEAEIANLEARKTLAELNKLATIVN